MAEIRQYRKEKQKIELTRDDTPAQNKERDYTRKIKVHRQRIRFIIIALLVLVMIAVFILCMVKHKSSYTGYSVEESVRRSDSGYAKYLKFGTGYIRCSRDGAAAYKYNGEQIWNKTFEIEDFAYDLCGNYFVIANIKGNDFYVFDTDGFVNSVNTALPIVQVSIASDGSVVAILEDKDVDYINKYEVDGKKRYTIKSATTDSGVPLSASISRDNKKLVVSYAAVDGLSIKSSVVFRNFGVVGQNVNQQIVGGFDFEQMVPKVQFVNSNTAVAFTESSVNIYSIKEYPKLVSQVEIDNEIASIFYSEEYFGVVYRGTDSDESQLSIYDYKGEKISSTKLDKDYADYKFTKNSVVMFNSTDITLISLKGKELYSGSFDAEITDIIPISDNDVYLYVSDEKIQKIKLK